MYGERNKSCKGSRLVAGAIATAFCAAGVAATIDWSLPATDRAPISRASRPAAVRQNHVVTDVQQASSRGLVTRQKVKCAGCGVIESMRRIEFDERSAGRCSLDEVDPTRLPGVLLDGGHGKEIVTLADTVAGAIGNEDGRKIRRTTGYQIVVRFRDGTRHVFTEKTPRSLRLGDRVLVVGPNRLDG